MGSPKILIFGERRKCCDLNSRASSLSQATYDEAVAIYCGARRKKGWCCAVNKINKISAKQGDTNEVIIGYRCRIYEKKIDIIVTLGVHGRICSA